MKYTEYTETGLDWKGRQGNGATALCRGNGRPERGVCSTLGSRLWAHPLPSSPTSLHLRQLPVTHPAAAQDGLLTPGLPDAGSPAEDAPANTPPVRVHDDRTPSASTSDSTHRRTRTRRPQQAVPPRRRRTRSARPAATPRTVVAVAELEPGRVGCS